MGQWRQRPPTSSALAVFRLAPAASSAPQATIRSALKQPLPPPAQPAKESFVGGSDYEQLSLDRRPSTIWPGVSTARSLGRQHSHQHVCKFTFYSTAEFQRRFSGDRHCITTKTPTRTEHRSSLHTYPQTCESRARLLGGVARRRRIAQSLQSLACVV